MQTTKAQSSRKRAGAPTHAELFEPIRIGNCDIKNRIAMAPMNVLFSADNRGYANEILAYYAARAQGGTGLIITECVLGTRLASRVPVHVQPAPPGTSMSISWKQPSSIRPKSFASHPRRGVTV